jgi:hypothetical protein
VHHRRRKPAPPNSYRNRRSRRTRREVARTCRHMTLRRRKRMRPSRQHPSRRSRPPHRSCWLETLRRRRRHRTESRNPYPVGCRTLPPRRRAQRRAKGPRAATTAQARTSRDVAPALQIRSWAFFNPARVRTIPGD